MFAVVAAYAGETVFEVPAVEELVHDLGDDRPKEAVTGLVAFFISLEKCVEMPLDALPQRRCLGLPGTIDLLHHADHCRKEGVPSNGIPLKKVRDR